MQLENKQLFIIINTNSIANVVFDGSSRISHVHVCLEQYEYWK